MMNKNRRSFFKQAGLLGLGSFAGLSTLANSFEKPTTASKRVIRVAHLTDIHVQPGKVSEYGFAQSLNEVNALKDKPDFILTGGDLIMDALSTPKDKVKEEWKVFHSILKSDNSLPVFNCLGNHDIFNWSKSTLHQQDGKKWATDELEIKKPYYSFGKGNWHFIVLDSIHSKNIPGYLGKIDEAQMVWLEAELASIPATKNTLVVSHIPIVSACTMFDGSTLHHNRWKISGSNLHSDAKQLKDLFHKYSHVKVALSGHIHLIDKVEYAGVSYYCNGAVSGAWWGGNCQEFPPSFSVINLYEDGSSDRELYFYNWKVQG